MELPAEVLIHNDILGFKGTKGTLLRVGDDGYYVLVVRFGADRHRLLLPIQHTAVVFQEPIENIDTSFEVER